jgi:5-methylcytosine-specific restriction endonuclease McrA
MALSQEERKARNREAYRKWREANREQDRERCRKWRDANPERVREQARKRRDANPELDREQSRKWRDANPEQAQKLSRQSQHIRRARKANAIDVCAPQVTTAAIDRRFWLFGNACAYCGDDGSLHLDHVDPLARGGLHVPQNLVPACERCNLSKGAKPVEAWYLSQPFFSPERWEALQLHTARRWTAAKQLSLLDHFS